MVRTRLLAMTMVFLLVVSYAWSPVLAFSSSDDISDEYVGPGKHESELYIRNQGSQGEAEELVQTGTVAMWNTRDEFIVSLETTDGWQITEVRIFVGTDTIPISQGGAPKIGQFPYVEHLESPAHSYQLTLNLRDDLDFTWGRRNAGQHIQNVSVCAKVVNQDTDDMQDGHEEAWAYGEKKFDVHWGWWSRYALSKPKTGHFRDAPVAGAGYRTGSQRGSTNSNGAFDYIEGELVTLSLGGLKLGTAPAKQRVTPLDLIGTDDPYDTRVINMARLLQSLDDDGDPKRGISITEEVIGCLETAADEMDITELDFDDTDMIDTLINTTAANCSSAGINLTVVSADEALDNLEKGLDSNVFRKNISKTPDMETAKAKLEVMPVYVPALRANGDPVQLVYKDEDDEITSIRDEAKPLVSVYADEMPGTDGAMDVFGAVSRDEGNTWKTTNLSRSADKSSFTLDNGYRFPGDVLKPNIKVNDSKILVVWTSYYASSGKPTYSIRLDDDYDNDDDYYEEDIWGVSGPQRSTDYTELGFPEVGELPYHCIWTCRGVIAPDTGDITWFKPERLTSGRRDAYQVMVNAAKNAGFALVWQEDPEGVRPGEMAGPGHGWSGATTNHKTDVWYSYIKWDDFDRIDENFVSGGDPQHDEDKELTGRPKVLVPFSLPVRISDNDTLNADSMKLVVDENGPIKDEEGNWVVDPTLESGKSDKSTGGNQSEKDSTDEDSENGQSREGSGKEDSSGSHAYGLEVPGLCDDFYLKVNNQGEEKWVAITSDNRLMDGDTGASRPNIMMQPYQKPDGKFSAWVAVCYEETKGLGAGPPEGVGQEPSEEDLEDDMAISGGAHDGTGSGAKRGQDAYSADKGKNVIYHSFDLVNPDKVSAGTIINPQATDENGNLLYLEDEEGNPIYDWDGETLIPAYENSRRPRLLIQSKKNALNAVDPGEDATVMVTVFKMGEEGKGRPSDIFMRRWVVVKDENDPSYKGNPYKPQNLVDAWQNISSVTPTETWTNQDSQSYDDPEQGRDPVKVVKWEQEEDNLSDYSWTNEYDDARAHRGFIKGDFLAIAYDWTPNWAPARNGNDIYNLYIRRSFDGGATWTTDPYGDGVTHHDNFRIYTDEGGTLGLLASDETNNNKDKEEITTFYGPGVFEPARNVSQLANTKETVIEPRLVGVPGTISSGYPEDVQDTSAFWVTYGTHSNPGRHSEEEGVPLDLYYSYSTDFGDEYYTITKTINPESKGNNAGGQVERWDWLAKDTGKKGAGQAECQIRMTPDGSVFYAVWNETGPDGSDVMFRRIMRNGGSIGAIESSDDITGPEITISGVNDGDIVSGDVSIDISLNEVGTWLAYLSEYEEIIDDFGQNDIPYTITADESEHTYVLTVDAQDSVGNKRRRRISFTVDGRIPVITIDGVTDEEITREDITISITATGDDTTISMTKDGAAMEFSDGGTLSQDGNYSLEVTSTNTTHDLTSTEIMSFTIDKLAPEITVTGVADGSSYSSAVTPVVSVADNHSTGERITTQILLNGDDFVSGTEISDVGSYELAVTAEDEAGNESTKTCEFSIYKKSSSNRDKPDRDTLDSSPGVTETIVHGQSTEVTTEDDKLKVVIPAPAVPEGATVTITPVEEGAELPAGILKIGNLIYSIEIKDQNGDSITQFDKSLVLEFYYNDEDIPEGVSEEDLKICYWDEEKQTWIVIPTEIDTIINKLTAVIDHLTVFGVMAILDFPALEDVRGHWAGKDVYKMVSLKIASGDINGKLRPEDEITREEFAKLIVLAAGLRPEVDPNLTFADADSIVPWARGYVAAAVKAGIIQGYEDNTFKPARCISRVEIATVIVRALKMQLQQQAHISFGDEKDIPQWGVPYVAKAVEKGIVTGFSDGTFKPGNNATRAQAMVMVCRMLNVQ